MIDSQDSLDRLLAHLEGVPEVAVDCEMDSMYAYRTSLCLVQMGWPDGEALIDGLAPLDRSGLGALFADPDVVKVFHGGENDIGLMADRWGMSFANIFDTMAASQVLGHDGVGLAAVLDRSFGVKLSKRFQKSDWRVRPLPADQADYARLDVRYLIPLRRLLLDELEHLNRVEEAESEFARIARARIEEKAFDRDAWVRLRGAREIAPGRRAVLRALFVARDAIAQSSDRAPYRVLQNGVLLDLAQRCPETAEDMFRVRGMNRRLARADVDRLLTAIRNGRSEGEIPFPSRSRRPWEPSADARLTPEQEVIFKSLRSWRARRAKDRGVDVSRVATTALLAAIARARPSNERELSRIDGVEPWRVREYGADMLAVISEASS